MGSAFSKRLLASVHDIVMAFVAITLALVLRYGGLESMQAAGPTWLWIVVFAAICGVVFPAVGLGRGIWRFASLTDLRAIVIAVTAALLVFVIAMFVINRLEGFPRTVPIITWFLLIVLLGAPRLVYRGLKEGQLGLPLLGGRSRATTNLIVIGSAAEADRVIRTHGLERSRERRVHAIVDYEARKDGRFVRGVPMVGDISELEAVVARLARNGVRIDAALLASPEEARRKLPSFNATLARLNVPILRMASRTLGDEPNASSNLEAISLEDLLGRPPVRLARNEIDALVRGRTIAITGAGGSIGSEIVRQLAGFGPARLVLLENSEYALYTIDQTLARDHPELSRRAVIADIRDRQRLSSVLHEEGPSVLFHAAALKHVPLAESNPCEAVRTNVLGTRNVADIAVELDAQAMVMISTDKAVRPPNIMGASKRVAESYCQALDVSGVRTRFITVRFGNVLGSTGSVVPLFKEQIGRGGPVTVTHPDITRYFMTIKEASELVLQAAAHGINRPDQRGRIMSLDMGQPVKIDDLARTMIVLAGMTPDRDVRIAYTGLRPGEKLFEELRDDEESDLPSGAEGVLLASARLRAACEVDDVLNALSSAIANEDAGRTRLALHGFTPTLPPSEPARESA